MKPLILLSNDDGLNSAGFRALIQAARPFGDLLAVVPDGDRSGMSTAFTVKTPLSLNKVSEEPGLTVYTSNGTPVDCVKIGVNLLGKERRPDLVLSGINHGFNGSVAVHYSGTMGVTLEGCMSGIPSIGFSLDCYAQDADFSPSLPWLQKIIAAVLENALPQGVCLNVNIPLGPVKGIRPCRQANGHWVETLLPCQHPYRTDIYWLTGYFVDQEPADACDHDGYWMKQGYITVVPQQLDMTCRPLLEEMKNWF